MKASSSMAEKIIKNSFYISMMFFVIYMAFHTHQAEARYGDNIRMRSFSATNKTVEINNTTFTKVLDANPSRRYVFIASASKEEVYIGLCPATPGGVGIIVYDGQPWIMSPLALYSGEICAKSTNGTQNLFIVEF
jgi:hypothetical protein